MQPIEVMMYDLHPSWISYYYVDKLYRSIPKYLPYLVDGNGELSLRSEWPMWPMPR